MPGIDKPTGRVVALIVLLIVVAAALRGYLPAHEHAARSEAGANRAALVFVAAALGVAVALVAFAVIARLRDPRALAPYNRDLSEMLGTGRGRPNWRVLLIGLGVIVAWLLVAILLSRVFAPHQVTPPPQTPDVGAPPSPRVNPQPPQQPHPRNDNGDMLGILLAATVPLLLIIVAGSATMALRRWRASKPVTVVDDPVEPAPPPKPSESLARAAELGLAEIGDLNRQPREAIIACYAAMERELAHVPGAAPQDFDTPTEVVGRAVENHALQVDNAVQLVNLFEEARFSPHVMNEGHRETAVQVLRLVLADLRSPV
ncbi:DUF4129 domain-containing protein [Mycobacterium sp. 663a-19]|uniref:DUF4129 domain-containing protein n=1 Tax=Mycobacterium sp. 663a-19 TaxID=2986148 RepID=UPI002D1EB479|nr:DUF4129 domain-containing protein [Mycobacterium sp. 663a-19]MEB3982102.1 DUF4129 domain-containing protein [Mycobacterium sp. 663a-19]